MKHRTEEKRMYRRDSMRENLKEIPVMTVRHSGVLMMSVLEKHSAVVQRINTPRLNIFANKSLEEWQA